MVLLDFLPLFPHFFILAYFSRLLGDIPFSPAPPSIALKSSSDNEMTFPRRIPLALKQYPMEQNWSLGANQLLPSSPPCWTFAAHLRVGFDCKQTRVRNNFPGIYLFIYLCPSTPNLMKTGVAVTWGGFEFPNTVLLQPVNSLVIAALQEEKKTFYPQKSKWQQKWKTWSNLQRSFLKHTWFSWSVHWWHFRAML